MLLREGGRIDPSKLLIRPMIELMIRLQIAGSKPELFYRMILTERLKRNQWIEGAAKRAGTPHDKKLEVADWSKFRAHCLALCPSTDLKEEGISIRTLAKEIGLLDHYHSVYSLYCNFTHGALQVVTGTLDQLSDTRDNQTASGCVLSTLQVFTDCWRKHSWLRQTSAPPIGSELIHERAPALSNRSACRVQTFAPIFFFRPPLLRGVRRSASSVAVSSRDSARNFASAYSSLGIIAATFVLVAYPLRNQIPKDFSVVWFGRICSFD